MVKHPIGVKIGILQLCVYLDIATVASSTSPKRKRVNDLQRFPRSESRSFRQFTEA